MSRTVDDTELVTARVEVLIGAFCLVRDNGRLEPMVRMIGFPQEGYVTPEQARRIAERLIANADQAETFTTTIRAQPGSEALAGLEPQGNA